MSQLSEATVARTYAGLWREIGRGERETELGERGRKRVRGLYAFGIVDEIFKTGRLTSQYIH